MCLCMFCCTEGESWFGVMRGPVPGLTGVGEGTWPVVHEVPSCIDCDLCCLGIT